MIQDVALGNGFQPFLAEMLGAWLKRHPPPPPPTPSPGSQGPAIYNASTQELSCLFAKPVTAQSLSGIRIGLCEAGEATHKFDGGYKPVSLFFRVTIRTSYTHEVPSLEFSEEDKIYSQFYHTWEPALVLLPAGGGSVSYPGISLKVRESPLVMKRHFSCSGSLCTQ